VKKVAISLERDIKYSKYRKVGLLIYEDEGDEEVQKLIRVVEECLQKNFPSTPIVRRKAVRELFGE